MLVKNDTNTEAAKLYNHIRAKLAESPSRRATFYPDAVFRSQYDDSSRSAVNQLVVNLLRQDGLNPKLFDDYSQMAQGIFTYLEVDNPAPKQIDPSQEADRLADIRKLALNLPKK